MESKDKFIKYSAQFNTTYGDCHGNTRFGLFDSGVSMNTDTQNDAKNSKSAIESFGLKQEQVNNQISPK